MLLRSLSLFSVIVCSACAGSFHAPRNISDLNGSGYQTERQSMSDVSEAVGLQRPSSQNLGRCQDMDLALSPLPMDAGIGAAMDVPGKLSPGDMLNVEIVKGDGFNGDYVVSPDGYLKMPFIGELPAAGTTMMDLENTISRLLVAGGFFKANFAHVDVSVLHWAPIQVSVSGAVFQTGDVLLNERKADEDSDIRVSASGDFTQKRRLSAALSAAAGVRPDADIRNIVLIRAGQRRIFDLSGAIHGHQIVDPLLVAGDRIHVPSRGCFQQSLTRPSHITPPGVRVFMSNLTRPALSNANSAIGRHSTELPYGTRMLQGLVSANCVGGIQATNARRWGVLISRNPVTGESEVVARSIEDLVRRSDRDEFNPVLLPNDAIACYDSHVTNVRDVISALTEAAVPILNIAILGGAIR